MSVSPRRRTVVTTALVCALAVAAAALSTPRPAIATETYLEGVDVSRWQGKPVWSQVKAAGIRFVIAKATQGDDWVDPQYAGNRARLRGNRIPFSAYHYADPSTTPGDAVAEADHFVNTARLENRNLLPVLDLERHNDLSTEVLAEWARTWLARVEERLRVRPMIYTSPAFWVERMGDSTWFADNGYRLWIAHWRVDSPTVPAANWGGHGWTLWQYDVRAGLSGFRGKVDRDRYNGGELAPILIRNNR